MTRRTFALFMSHALDPNFITALRNSETRAGGVIWDDRRKGNNRQEVYIKQFNTMASQHASVKPSQSFIREDEE